MSSGGPADTAARVEAAARVLHHRAHERNADPCTYCIADARALADAGLLDAPSRPTPADGLRAEKYRAWDAGYAAACDDFGFDLEHKTALLARLGIADSLTDNPYRVAATDDETPAICGELNPTRVLACDRAPGHTPPHVNTKVVGATW